MGSTKIGYSNKSSNLTQIKCQTNINISIWKSRNLPSNQKLSFKFSFRVFREILQNSINLYNHHLKLSTVGLIGLIGPDPHFR